MARKTTYIVYVDKEVMGNPVELADAVLTHFIKKEMDIATRKQFLAQFMKANNRRVGLKLIKEWVQVRDVVGFPFRKEQESEMAEAGIRGAKAGKALRDGIDKAIPTAKELADTLTIEKERDENTEATGDVPVDDGADEESESGSASE